MTPFNLWRLRRLNEKIAALSAEIEQLERAEKAYGNSYYTDRLIAAVGARAKLEVRVQRFTA